MTIQTCVYEAQCSDFLPSSDILSG